MGGKEPFERTGKRPNKIHENLYLMNPTRKDNGY